MHNHLTVLVTGATGAVGPMVVKILYDTGYRVRTLSIDAPPANIWQDGIEVRIGDITDPEDVQSAVQGVNGVIHLAALLHIVNPSPELREKYEQINIGGTANVVEAAINLGLNHHGLHSKMKRYRFGTDSDKAPC